MRTKYFINNVECTEAEFYAMTKKFNHSIEDIKEQNFYARYLYH